MRRLLTVLFLAIITVALVVTVIEMPVLGETSNPSNNVVAARYLEASLEETGALNVISSIILDYRAFDTLGEVTVLFVAIASAITTLKTY